MLSISWWVFRLWKLLVQKKLVYKLIAECTENIDEVKIAKVTLTEKNA